MFDESRSASFSLTKFERIDIMATLKVAIVCTSYQFARESGTVPVHWGST